MIPGEIESRIAALEERVAALELRLPGESPISAAPQKGLSISEFLVSKRPTTDVEKTLVVAYYLEKFSAAASVNISDLKTAFGKAREPPPINVNDAVNKNVQKGFMMEADEKKGGLKSWVVTNSGERHVSGSASVEGLPET